MSHARKAALHLLNNDWSRAVWKHWLSNIFLPPVEPPLPQSGAAPSSAESANAAKPQSIANNSSAPELGDSCSEYATAPDSTRDARRGELRVRFEALSERIGALEAGLDTLLERSRQREKSERRAETRSAEAIESLAQAAERQSSLLEALLDGITRIEHGTARLEQALARVDQTLGEPRRRDSHAPPPAMRAASARSAPPSSYPESSHAARERSPGSLRTGELEELDGNGSAFNGHLSEVSLATVLAMLEIERHSGRLKVATDDGQLASFEISEGNVVSSRLSENDTDPLHALRTALCWKHGRFWFRQQPAETASFAPRSIGSLLLDATRQNDESFADVG